MNIQRPGVSDEWFTPPEVFDALDCTFDLDPSQPETGREHCCVPTQRFFTKSDDGLTAPWAGFVWLNPPYGGRNGVVPWLKRFVEHGNGLVMVSALTSCGWFHQFAPVMDALLFPDGKTKFVRPDGTRAGTPNQGVVMMALGDRAIAALATAERNQFGMMARPSGRKGSRQ